MAKKKETKFYWIQEAVGHHGVYLTNEGGGRLRFETRQEAEQAIADLPKKHQKLWQVVEVTSN